MRNSYRPIHSVRMNRRSLWHLLRSSFLWSDTFRCQSSLKPSTLASARSWELGTNGIPESENGDVHSVGMGNRLGSTSNLQAAAGSVSGVSTHSLENTPPLVRRTKTPITAPVTPGRRTDSTATRVRSEERTREDTYSDDGLGCRECG